jgi:hypothetical protein
MRKTVGEILKEFDKNPSNEDPVILIDAVKLIRNMYEDGSFPLDAADSAVEKIKEQFIAYDVDKVIEQINEKDNKSAIVSNAFIWKDNAIEIVNAGGISE